MRCGFGDSESLVAVALSGIWLALLLPLVQRAIDAQLNTVLLLSLAGITLGPFLLSIIFVLVPIWVANRRLEKEWLLEQYRKIELDTTFRSQLNDELESHLVSDRLAWSLVTIGLIALSFATLLSNRLHELGEPEPWWLLGSVLFCLACGVIARLLAGNRTLARFLLRRKLRHFSREL